MPSCANDDDKRTELKKPFTKKDNTIKGERKDPAIAGNGLKSKASINNTAKDKSIKQIINFRIEIFISRCLWISILMKLDF